METINDHNSLYTTRMKIFVAGGVFLLLICLGRMAQIQLWPDPALREGLKELKEAGQRRQQFSSLRGDIRDRNDVLLATDKPKFSLQISYQLTQYADGNVPKAMQLVAQHQAEKEKTNIEETLAQTRETIESGRESLLAVLDQCALFVPDLKPLSQEMHRLNKRIWSRRTRQAWRHNCQKTALYQAHQHEINVPGSIPQAQYLADFREAFPDPNTRLRLIGQEDIWDMKEYYTLFILTSDEAVLDAQMEFAKTEFVRVASQGVRYYPKGAVAAQTIGWVGPFIGESDKALFADDPLSRYRPDDICGREDGVEYQCEPILRGSRGLERHDLDKVLIEEIPPIYGRDVTLTLDIELQEEIENYLLGHAHAPHCKPGMAVVLIDVASADILCLVSLPNYDLNSIRRNYGALLASKYNPLINRAINKHYKPGSTAKPIVLCTGLQTKGITPDEVIPCPNRHAPDHWPDCWILRKSHVGHDYLWPNNNNARHAIKGSCNIYFSRLAEERIPPRTLQKWLFKFGYGRQIPLPTIEAPESGTRPRRLRQASGIIGSKPQYGKRITSLDDIPALQPTHRRLVGMGEGVFAATVLQIANTMATLARNGLAITPRLYRLNSDQEPDMTTYRSTVVDLDLSDTTLETVLGGMDAVVNENQGTAYDAFEFSDFTTQGVKVYGKTGSTQDPNNALFAGFARDTRDTRDRRPRTVALALVIEGGESGSGDAAPLARDIFQKCIDAGYIGEIK